MKPIIKMTAEEYLQAYKEREETDDVQLLQDEYGMFYIADLEGRQYGEDDEENEELPDYIVNAPWGFFKSEASEACSDTLVTINDDERYLYEDPR